MKKINFQKLSDKQMFGSLTANKLDMLAMQTESGSGTTATSLCKTTEAFGDTDLQGDQESLADPRCIGY